MPQTTQYASWGGQGIGTMPTIEEDIRRAKQTQGLGDHVHPLEASEFRAAINRHLPDSITLHGNDFYGDAGQDEESVLATIQEAVHEVEEEPDVAVIEDGEW